MRIKQVCVLGGSGFVGSSIVNQLSEAGYEVKVLARRREASKHLILLPNVQVADCDVMDDAALAKEIKGADAVVNVIGILHESKKATFKAIHVELPKRITAICKKLGVKRLLHMSALQASKNAPSAYLRSKAAGEAAVMAQAEYVQVTIFRPSVIFGRGDNFLNLFSTLVKLMPAIVLAKPDAKFQPIWVEDVAKALVNSLQNVDTYGNSYDLGGPRIYSLRELVQFVVFVLGKKRMILGLNDKLSYMQAQVLELLPVKLMTRDNIDSMQVDSVTMGDFPKVFGFKPTSMEAVVPEYLADDTPRAAYDRFRSLAGR
ncbi:MAG TPA: complex I NDUFA9 subunit family protein [Methylophilaceae bacterium]|nr:complex I NDUFA9 subunit family protein [Methylophilaceae bacterium]